MNVIPTNHYGIGSWGSAIIVLIIAFYISMHSLPLLLLREQLDNSVRSTLARLPFEASTHFVSMGNFS